MSQDPRGMLGDSFGYERILRRLPVYLLIEPSAAMAGAPIQAVNTGLRLIHDELMKDPMAIETLWLSLITFGTEARQIVPLAPITQLAPPQLTADGGTSLGAALWLLNQKLDEDIIRNSPERKGDYKALVLIMIMGSPSDAWEPAAEAMRSSQKQKLATITALGCGGADGVEESILRRIADHVLMMAYVSDDQFYSFFRWVSQSVSMASKSAQAAADDQEAETELPAPPEGIKIIF